ncbi:S-adenosylmethionine decarboxylase proenzyme [Lucilia cuprina]|uniref:S-adenosylmethionine decarboxylase proenzyme n=1 Tax=Lucilia cuprina TaxID=7375 RepID=UPI001F05DA30|nr:S-adenosylmethionine decarboxylase proenzyme [Lucilia cuprina]
MGENTQHYFEGVEKLVEVWFKQPPMDDEADLRRITKEVWDEELKAVKCEIISFTKNSEVDAYVLSESSMFVSKRRWILKTCGTTTPLNCLKPLMKMAAEMGFVEISDFFYSRKNFARPELQLLPHRMFCEEVKFLDTIFEGGQTYCLGQINKDCWYLYTLSQPERELKGDLIELPKIEGKHHSEPDQTIEILMENLDPQVMQVFTKLCCQDGKEATVKSKINEILPDMIIDDFLFEPCGYSMNGINQLGEYMTIHITPEKEFSYVSFESNVSMANYAELIQRVLATFLPAKFIITIFANKSSEAYATMRELETTSYSQWQRADMQCCNFPSYNLLFATYTANNRGENDC